MSPSPSRSQCTTAPAESAKPNPLNRKGIPTSVAVHPKRPTAISYIMGLAAIPAGFDRVAEIKAAKNGVDLISVRGHRVHGAGVLSLAACLALFAQ